MIDRRTRSALLLLPVFVMTLLLGSAPSEQARASQPDPATPTEYVLRDALLLPSVGTGGRRPVHTDAVEAQIVAGTWATPTAGDAVLLPDGTTQAWREAAAANNGWLRADELRGGWAHWSVESPAERVMILKASGHRMVYVNGAPRGGDVYGNGWVRLPVLLRAGHNDLLFHVSRGRVRAKLEEPPAAQFLSTREPTLADLIIGENWSVRGGVVVVNASREDVTDLVISAGGGGLPSRATKLPRVPAMSIRKVPFWYGGSMPPDVRSCRVGLELSRTDDGGVRRVLSTAEVRAGVRRSGERHRRTFISEVDGSVQYYAITPMRVRHEDAEDVGDVERIEKPWLYLTLHGAGVEGAGQAAVYTPKKRGHVVAPTNRRPFGFDWEDWGRMDALEVLAIAETSLGTDPDRTYLTGHSMGGHGTWHLGVTFPDRFAAIGPSAGWRSFASYAGAEPLENASGVEALLRRATNPSDTESLARNTLHCGVYILHGDKDDNVPVEQGRYMFEHLRKFHPDVVYHEEPGAGHWWGNRCCDWDPMFAFFAEHTRPRTQELDVIEFHTANPGVSAWSRWVGIEQQIAPLAFSRVEGRFDRAGRRITLGTSNVARLALKADHLEPGEPVTVEIDGSVLPGVETTANAAPVSFTRSMDDERMGWSVAGGPVPPGEKGPHRAGPFKEAFRHRMMFVYGTIGNAEENEWARDKARFDAETFWYRGNGAVDVIPDVEFDAKRTKDRNVIVYGNADTNAAWSGLLGESPVQVTRGAIRIGERVMEGDDLAVLLLRPRPESDAASVGVVTGSGPRGMRLTDRLPYFVSGVAYPDCIVIGPEVLRDGASGVRVAGYFGRDWSVEGGTFAWRGD